MSKIHVTAKVNGDAVEFLCEAGESLLDVLRDRLNLTGAKEGCGTGDCGACSVTIDGRLVASCLVLGAEVEGSAIETVEGIGTADALHPLQRHLLEHAALQCGICTPVLSSRPRHYLWRTQTLPKKKCAIGWRATCAAAQAMTRSSARC